MSIAKKRVIFIVHYFNPRIGGVEKHVLSLSQSLIKMNYSVTIITSQHELDLKKYESFNNINLFRINANIVDWSKPSKLKIWLWFIRNRGLFQDVEIIHCHDVFIWYLPLRFILPFKKVYITFHGYEGMFPVPIKNIIVRKLSEKLTHKNICIGRFIEKWYGTKPDVISYGATDRIENTDIPVTNTILFIGRMDYDSGLHVFLKCLDVLKSKKISINVEFAGNGKLRKEAMKYGHVHGFLSDVTYLLRRNQFIFTGGYLSLLEAYIHKRLAFSVYDNPLKKDYFDLSPHAKFAVIRQNHIDLADSIEYYLRNPDDANLKVNSAYEWARLQTWDKLALKYISLWKK